MIFYLTVPDYTVFKKTSVPLFVNRAAIFGEKRMGKANYARYLRGEVGPEVGAKVGPARGPWCLDSGGFMALTLKDRQGNLVNFDPDVGAVRWPITHRQYVEEVRYCHRVIGNLVWAAPLDWMCEPVVIANTGLSVHEHQLLTAESYLKLRAMGGEELAHLWIPVLQGACDQDYLDHYDMYLSLGVNLAQADWVGVGSVCRRQSSSSVVTLFEALSKLGLRRLHAFGLKKTGLPLGASEHVPYADPEETAAYRLSVERGLWPDEAMAQIRGAASWDQVSRNVCGLIYSADSNAWSLRSNWHLIDIKRLRREAFGPGWKEQSGRLYAANGDLLGDVVVAAAGTKDAGPFSPTQMTVPCAVGRARGTRGLSHRACNSHVEWALAWRDELRAEVEAAGCEWHSQPYMDVLPPAPIYGAIHAKYASAIMDLLDHLWGRANAIRDRIVAGRAVGGDYAVFVRSLRALVELGDPKAAVELKLLIEKARRES